MILGKWDKEALNAVPYIRLNKNSRGSYPNYCKDYEDNIHVVHTDGREIAHHILTTEYLDQLKPANLNESIPLIDIDR